MVGVRKQAGGETVVGFRGSRDRPGVVHFNHRATLRGPPSLQAIQTISNHLKWALGSLVHL